MPKVTIVRPNNTLDEQEKALRNIADVMKKVMKKDSEKSIDRSESK